MIRTVRSLAALLAVWSVPISAAAQEHAGHGAQATPAARAFEHYEGVRKALSSDRLVDVAPHAKGLAIAVVPIAGEEAQKLADTLASATTIEDARTQFGKLSTILVPKFQEANLPGVTAFICSMKKQPWAQRGTAIENPYYGKAMLTCGTPASPKAK